ncbi:MAG: pyridoxal 5'-phosphate synthase glutaminase subunit PdxT [Blastocatellia bacterium]
MRIGVLAIQGDFAAHCFALRRIGADAIEVRAVPDLDGIDGLIIPGGESTTMLKLIEEEGFDQSIARLAGAGKPILGTCAGTILLAREVYNPTQPSLGLIDITVERNAYGRQVDSFIANAETTLDGGTLEGVFIRAPRIKRVGPHVEVLASLKDEPVLVRDNNILVATFHPELTEDRRVHRLLLGMAQDVNCSQST